MTQSELFTLAFKLGLMITREGFNGECDYDHCGPLKLEPEYGCGTTEQYLSYLDNTKLFNKLLKEAMEKYLKE